jgi:hypothetical protein
MEPEPPKPTFTYVRDPLKEALWDGDMEKLMEAARDLPADFRDQEGCTLLMLAVAPLFPEAVEFFLSKGVDPTLQDPKGRTAHDYLREALANCEFYQYGFRPEDERADEEDRYRRIRAMLSL